MNKKSKTLIIIFNILVFLFYIFVYLIFVCTCGHHIIKIMPSIFFTIIQIVLLVKFNKLENWNMKKTILFLLCSIMAYIILFILSLNDMDELHNMDIMPMDIDYTNYF